MLSNLKFLILGLSILVVPFLITPTASAQYNPLDPACKTISDPSKRPPQCDPKVGATNPIAGPNGILNKAATFIAMIAGIAAVIVIIVSGFMFVTAGGGLGGQRSTDPNKVKTARAALTGSLIGLVVIALAWTIIHFVTTTILK